MVSHNQSQNNPSAYPVLVNRRWTELSPALKNRERGVALVIVLSFVVLVTGLLVAFFSRSILDRQISNSSASQTRVECFAQGAMATVLADLKQEIILGSTNAGTAAHPVYVPKSGSNVMPTLVGSTGTNGMENLLKVSGSALFHPGVVSTASTSLNGRFISAARWNKPLLMPVTGTNDYTPQLQGQPFVAPSWVLVTRSGSSPGSWSAQLKNSGTNGTSVVGRYAYAIYNEGGMLDANVAGYPSVSGSGGVGPLGMDAIQNQTLYKTTTSYADLTQIGLSGTQIDALVGWRNYATTSANGSLGNGFAFPAPAKTSAGFFGWASRNPSGFLTTGTAFANSQTDRMFMGRQQLLEFLGKGLGLPATSQAFQCLSTFSRSLNQPSYVPAEGRPKVVERGYVSGLTYSNGNSAYELEDVINPIFSKVRVSTPFIRNDGFPAREGEPLVKTRFALDRLCWITCQGPSADIPGGPTSTVWKAYMAEGISPELLEQGTVANIEKFFGLRWTAGLGSEGLGGWWTYRHGFTDMIGTLQDPIADSDVLRQGREPDFFELLKAAITVGSLARGRGAIGLVLDRICSVYEHREHTRVDNQIIQIGANIIDQFAPDSYPTRIIFNDGSARRSFYGVDDLPLLYGVSTRGLVTGTSTPAVSPGLTPQAGTLLPGTEGQITALQFPVIWNPHSSGKAMQLRPTNLRISVSNFSVTAPNSVTVNPADWRPRVRPVYPTTVAGVGVDISGPWTYISWWSLGSLDPEKGTVNMPTLGLNTALLFDNLPSLYRHPTALIREGYPGGSNLQPAPGNPVATNPVQQIDPQTGTPIGSPLIGFKMDTCPLRWTGTDGKIYTGKNMGLIFTNYSCTYSLEYNVGGDNWIPYQQRLVPIWGSGGRIPVQPMLDEWSGTPNQVGGLYTWDPRARRWTIEGNTGGMRMLDRSEMVVETVRPGTAIGQYSHGHVIGGFSKDNFYVPASGSPAGYGTDADGVVRRPMGAYVPGGTVASTAIGLPLATTWGTASSANVNNRPIILHRPFRSVAELGYVFSDHPWRNLDLFTPESGAAPLLDVFCIHPTSASTPMVAGKVDLNTRQVPVLAALLSGAGRNESDAAGTQALTVTEAQTIAAALVNRTTNRTTAGKGPLANIAELVGRYGQGFSNEAIPPAPSFPYDGFSKDLGGLYSGARTSANNLVGRFRESAMRSLSDTGQVGTWNLLIDLVAQVGRYPSTARGPSDFMVEGEKRCWLHIAIDRQTAEIIDQEIEEIKE